MFDLSGKTALITGSSQGIGLAAATALAENGAKVYINGSKKEKVYAALEEICREFDLGIPIWLDSNISEFKRISKTRFTKDSFMEDIPFDYLEIQIIEEDQLFR